MGGIESSFIFRTAISNSILPFAFYRPSLVVLPIRIEKTSIGRKTIVVYSDDELRNRGFRQASRWFREVEDVWNANKTEKNKNKNTTAREWLNWQSKLTAQVLNSPYLVLYSSSAKDANAVLVKRAEIDCEFIVDHKTYNFPTSDLYEAYYLAAILNSAAPNKMMKDFQSRGLYGARDVHKKILDIYWPLFESNNDLHMNLARLSENAHVKASEFLALDPARQNLTPRHLGRLRLEIKQHLKNELREIDALVETLIGAAA